MFKFNTIEEALQDLREGKITIVADDENRENEWDFICAVGGIEMVNLIREIEA